MLGEEARRSARGAQCSVKMISEKIVKVTMMVKITLVVTMAMMVAVALMAVVVVEMLTATTPMSAALDTMLRLEVAAHEYKRHATYTHLGGQTIGVMGVDQKRERHSSYLGLQPCR
jgi:heme/copper-type cytochrome/quinol oxidase subunit 2